MATAFAVLIAYHVLFYWKAYFIPFDLARSELLSTFFPSWVHLGREGAKHDPYYWGNYHAHPVLASWYPTNIVSSIVSKDLHINARFIILVATSYSHMLFASIGWYILFAGWTNHLVALFGSITLTYSAYNIKQQPCINYTIGWFPWLLLGIATNTLWLSSLSLGMVLLAGYYPIGLQVVIISIIATLLMKASVWWVVFGSLIGLVQVIPFLKHLPSTIRNGKHDDIGRVPWWQIPLELILPTRIHLNGVGYQEMSYYIGLTPLILMIMSYPSLLPLSFIFILLMMGAFSKYFPRIPARWAFSFQVSLGVSSVAALNQMNMSPTALIVICVVQMLDLYLRNSTLLVTSPYTELSKKPSRSFKTTLTEYLKDKTGRVSGLPYPLFTGHINQIRGLGYCGGMQTKEMAKLRGDTNPNGSGFHDWFKLKEDGKDVDSYGIRYAYTRKRPVGWLATPVRFLWENPRVR